LLAAFTGRFPSLVGRAGVLMNIVVLMKQVPDTEGARTLDPADNTVDRGAVDPVINYIDEFAIEEGLLLREAHDGDVTLLTVGPERATESIRKALSMGVDKAVHVSDPVLHGSDAIQTTKVLAAALGTLEWDVVVAGSEATDSRMSVVPAMLAEVLEVPQLSQARKVTVDGDSVSIERLSSDGYDVVRGRLPAVISVVEKINEPRYPSFKGIMAAKSKPVKTLTVADLDLDAEEFGLAAASTEVVEFAVAPPRQAGQVVVDEGDGGVKIAEFLASRKLV
jgi:electron transfer flavoprotein beta subunit